MRSFWLDVGAAPRSEAMPNSTGTFIADSTVVSKHIAPHCHRRFVTHRWTTRCSCNKGQFELQVAIQ